MRFHEEISEMFSICMVYEIICSAMVWISYVVIEKIAKFRYIYDNFLKILWNTTSVLRIKKNIGKALKR